MTGKTARLYFHIPFCQHKCAYCHFYVLPNKQDLHLEFMGSLRKEWEIQRKLLKGRRIPSVYFGGGTPALLGPERIGEILDWVRNDPDCTLDPQAEITLEANPEDVSIEQMEAFRRQGINRVSLGLQVLDDCLLMRLERQHNAERAMEAVHQVKEAGIENITVDLIYDLPKQSVASWARTLELLRDLPIQHLSLYNLVLEPRSAFFKWRQEIEREMPDPEASVAMLKLAQEHLQAMGLQQYEISAFARPGYEAQHNRGYWLGDPFLGLGPSAFSYWEQRRFRNVAHLRRYGRELDEGRLAVDFDECLEPLERRRELLAIGLRLVQGVDLDAFQAQHGSLDRELFPILDQLEHAQLLTREGNLVRLSERGRLFYDTVASEIV